MNENYLAKAKEVAIPAWKFDITSAKKTTTTVVTAPLKSTPKKLPSSWAWDILLLTTIIASAFVALIIRKLKSA